MESDFELEKNDVLESIEGTTLESLNPDSWNNIPFCLIQGIKCCKESCLASIQSLEDLSHKMDRTNNQQKNTNHVLNNQLSTTESKLMTKSKSLMFISSRGPRAVRSKDDQRIYWPSH